MNVVQEGGVDNYSEFIFNPFPRASSTLITAPSLSGKSLFLKKIIERQELYFRDPIERVVVLNCNPRVSFYTLEQQPSSTRPLPSVEEYLISEFNFDSLGDGDVCIVEDLQSLTDEVRLLLTALCHHANLVHVFLIAHGVLGQKNFEILSLVHRVLLFLQSTAVGRLSSYIIQHFYLDPDIKDLLRKVLAVCSKHNKLLLLEINNLPATIQPFHLAISDLLALQDSDCPFAIIYPYPSKKNMYSNITNNTRVLSLTTTTNVSKLPSDEEIVEGSFVLLDKSNIGELRDRKGEEESEPANHDECLARDQWDAVVCDLETQIEDFIPNRYWLTAKSLLKEILRNDCICILEDGRRMKIVSKPNVVVGITDFITVAIRRDGPGEILRSNTEEYRIYRMFVKCMLEKHCPKSVFKNKVLLQNPHSTIASAESRGLYKRQKRKHL